MDDKNTTPTAARRLLPTMAGYASLPPPPLHITTTPGVPPIHELKGWDELNRWGMVNHPQWHEIQRRLEWAEGMSEIDKLRLLAGEMLRMHTELMAEHLKLVSIMPPPPLFIPHNDEPMRGQPLK